MTADNKELKREYNPGDVFCGFRVVRVRDSAEVGGRFVEFVHEKTGAELVRKALAVLDYKNALLGIIRDKLELRTLPDGTQVIGMKPVFSTFDEEEFSVLEDFLHVGEEDE